MKKFYNIFMSIVLVIGIIGSCLIASSCFSSNNKGNGRQMYSNVPNGSSTVVLGNNSSISDYYYAYLESVATVCVYYNGTLKSFGSGIAVYDGGFLVTNYHVISSITTATNPLQYDILLNINIKNSETNELEFVDDVEAELIWFDEDLDLAIIRSEQNMPTVPMADRWIDCTNAQKLKVAETLWTMGTPVSMSLFATFSQGYLSGYESRIAATEVESILYLHETLIQHTASISSGNSGGALFDANGNLVGINTMSCVSSSNVFANDIYFSVPIYPIIKIIDEIYLQECTNSSSYDAPTLELNIIDKYYYDGSTYRFQDDNLYVLSVLKRGATALGNIKAGDIVVGIANGDATSVNDASYVKLEKKYDLEYALFDYKSGDTITLFSYSSSDPTRTTLVLTKITLV